MSESTNPLLEPGFPIPFDRIEARHLQPAATEALREAEATLAAARSGPVEDATAFVERLERGTERLDWVGVLAEHIEQVASTADWRAAHEAVRPALAAFGSRMLSDPVLYRRVLEAVERAPEGGDRLQRAVRRYLRKTAEQMRRMGAALPPEEREELAAIDRETAACSARFAQQLLDATASWERFVEEERLAGLPASARILLREAARARGRKGWRLTLQAPSVLAVLTHAEDQSLREELWWAYNTRASAPPHDNTPLVRTLLSLRRRKAELLGYRNFVDLVLEDRMAGSAERAQRFVSDMRERIRPAFEREREELERFARERGAEVPLAPWDVGFWAERLRRERTGFDPEALRPYFSADRVLQGLFAVAGRLYGVSFRRIEAPVWAERVQVYELLEAGRRLGVFYVDPFPRETKVGGAWMSPLRTVAVRDGMGGEPQIALLAANVTPPSEEGAALLSFEEARTLFHEFGHLMHQLLTRVPLRSLGGTHVAWDFVELPSQIMENWLYEREVLDLFARHVETGASLPDSLHEVMLRARTFRAASAAMRQLGFAQLDLSLHLAFDPEGDEDLLAFARRVLEAHAPTPLPEGYAMVTAFSHLFASPVGYAGGYYSYKWAEMLEADAFTVFAERGVLNEATGRAFRRAILERGDEADPMALFVDFVGRPPDPDALLRRDGILSGGAG